MKKTLALILASLTIVAAAPAQTGTTVMKLVRSIPLPDITGGDFDHFASDLKTNRLYVTAEGHKSVEVFNLRTGEHLTSVGGFENPHSIYLVPDRNALFIADGGAAEVKILDVKSLKIVGRIATRPSPDAAHYDAAARLLYVGSGGRGEKVEDSSLSVISVDARKEIARIPVDANNVESMAIDHATNRMFVNLRDKKQIGVLDLKTRQFVARWDLPGLQLNTPIAFDPKTHRLFVVGRKPGLIVVVDTDTGMVKSSQPCVDIADDMTFDPRTNRIYVTGAEGLSIYDRVGTDDLKEIQRLDTKGGKTSTFVPALAQFYVPHTQAGETKAALEVYSVAAK